MQLVKTDDKSFTFFNKDYGEWYHSKSGAIEEAKLKFVDQLDVQEGDTILDICFGLGYNTYAAILKRKKLKIVCLEKDPQILEKLQELDLEGKYEIIKELAKTKFYKDKDYNLKLLVGPAELTIKKIKEKFGLVFLDPFSPKNNPELWTKNFFKEIKRVMKPGGKLATYSCARIVRDNLKVVGFKVEDGIKLHRRGPSTIAIKKD